MFWVRDKLTINKVKTFSSEISVVATAIIIHNNTHLNYPLQCNEKRNPLLCNIMYSIYGIGEDQELVAVAWPAVLVTQLHNSFN